jgi:hypothetical protein
MFSRLATYRSFHPFPSRSPIAICRMNAACVALAEGFESNKPRTYRALSKCHNIPRTTLWNRAHGQPSIKEKPKRQQYLSRAEENALAKYLIHMSDRGYPIRAICVPSLAFIIACQRSTMDVTIKPLGRNWHQAFRKRNSELNPRKVRAVDWNRHDNNIYDKTTHWFKVIGKVLQDPAVLPENVYNMDETGVIL